MVRPASLLLLILSLTLCSCTKPYEPVPPTIDPVKPTEMTYSSEPGPVDPNAPEEMTLTQLRTEVSHLATIGRKETDRRRLGSGTLRWLARRRHKVRQLLRSRCPKRVPH